MDALSVTSVSVGSNSCTQSLAISGTSAGTAIHHTILVETIYAYHAVAFSEDIALKYIAGFLGGIFLFW